MTFKFDNIDEVSQEARTVELPVGKTTVSFGVKYVDLRGIEYSRVRQKVNKPFSKMIEADALPALKDRELAVTAFVRFALVSWDGVTSNGQPVPFSEEAAIAFLMASPKTFYDLLAEASELDNYKLSGDDEKN